MDLRTPDYKVTLVVFARDLDARLNGLIDELLKEVRGTLGPHWRESFKRGLDRLHFTIMGLEAFDVNGKPAGYHALNNDDKLVWCQYEGLLNLFRLYRTDQPIWSVRIGGYRQCNCSSTTLAEMHCPAETLHSFGGSARDRSFYLGGRKLMLTGWPVVATGVAVDQSLYRLRRRAVNCGFQDKFHVSDHPKWRDNDFYGAIADLPAGLTEDSSTAEKIAIASEMVRHHLSQVEPLYIPIPLSALKVVAYSSDDFVGPLRQERLSDLLTTPERIEQLISRTSAVAVGLFRFGVKWREERSPLVSIPPLWGGDFQGMRVYRSDFG